MNIKITYETLFEVLRTEKSREELQKLDEVFFSDIINYLKEKETILENQKNNPDLTTFDEEKKEERQMSNIKNIIKEIYERREKKIINIALNKSKTNSNIIDNSTLLPEEKTIFNELVNLLNKARKDILFNILNTKLPDFKIEKKEEIKNKEEPKPEIKQEIKPEQNTEPKTNKLIRFVRPVPKFVGPELENYGPFEEDDIAKLPTKIADVLINKTRAEEINEG